MEHRVLKRSLSEKPTIARKSENSVDQHAMMGKLITNLLHGATKTHFTHLKTTSFAAHMALGEFYEAIPGLADAVAEQYQGATEQLLDYPEATLSPISTPEEAVDYLRGLYRMVQIVQDNCAHSEIVNELDVIKSQINTTKYKLIFLK
jgi:DNA-binding ferritin-like protein